MQKTYNTYKKDPVNNKEKFIKDIYRIINKYDKILKGGDYNE